MNTVDDFLSHYGVKGMKWGSRKPPEPGQMRPVGSRPGFQMRPVAQAKPGFQMKPVAKPGYAMKPVNRPATNKKRAEQRTRALSSSVNGHSFVSLQMSKATNAGTPLSALRGRGTKEALGQKFASKKINMNQPADFATEVRSGLTLRRR